MLRSASASVPALARAGERLGLLGLQLERDGRADDGVLAVFFLRGLIDREHANVCQDDFRAERRRLLLGGPDSSRAWKE